jgi:metal-responsive CopG/Arc/MetJ family transcriptional regulator
MGKTFVTRGKKKMGRPVSVAADAVVTVRLRATMRAAVDAFAKQESLPSRGEAIRQLIEDGLAARASRKRKGAP